MLTLRYNPAHRLGRVCCGVLDVLTGFFYLHQEGPRSDSFFYRTGTDLAYLSQQTFILTMHSNMIHKLQDRLNWFVRTTNQRSIRDYTSIRLTSIHKLNSFKNLPKKVLQDQDSDSFPNFSIKTMAVRNQYVQLVTDSSYKERIIGNVTQDFYYYLIKPQYKNNKWLLDIYLFSITFYMQAWMTMIAFMTDIQISLH